MPQVFHRATNTWSKMSIAAAVGLLAGGGWLGLMIARSPYVNRARVVRPQPVPFSHKHHVQQIGIDCRYCHWTVEKASFAGIPSTELCMGCHTYILSDSPMLAPVRESYREAQPIAWTRVHDLPDFVYFNHAIHVARGLDCAVCHGPVAEMPLVWRQATLHMEWCLECHREPLEHVRQPETMLAVRQALQPPRAGTALVTADQEAVIDSAVKLTNCSTCHR